ncbi:MAG: GTPase [Planctomyces sp.]
MQYPVETALQASVLTASGPGAVAVIRLEGHLPLQENPFRPFVRPDEVTPQTAQINRLLYGRWHGEDLVIVRTATHCWEIQCHGGSVAVQRILQDLQATGARVVPGTGNSQSISRAQDLSPEQQADELIRRALQLCRTREAAERILQQADGRQVRLLQQRAAGNTDALEQSQRWLSFTNSLLRGFRVLLTGEPNAGKSSLLNALCGRQRAIVSDVPGTTRDLLDAETTMGGWIIRFVDSAGVRDDATSDIETEGIRRSLTATGAVDLICCIAELKPIPDLLLQTLATARCPVLLVQNKADLLTSDSDFTFLQPLVHPFAERVQVSAATGAGLEELKSCMLRLLVPALPPSEMALPLADFEAMCLTQRCT